MTPKKFYLADLKATEEFGQNIGQIVEAGTIIALSGQIGSGKTTLVKAIAAGLNVEEIVTSPTFVIMNEYHSGRLPLYHLDLYRLFESAENLSPDLLLGQLDEVLNTNSVILIEWAEIFADQFNQDLNRLSQNGYLSLKLEAQPDNDHARTIVLVPFGQKDQTAFKLFNEICKH